MSTVLPPHSFYVVSYPRSGNTWLLNCLTMILDAVQGEAYHPHTPLTELHGNPAQGFHFWCEPRQRPDQPICIKSHDALDRFRQRHPPAPIIYIARDARDSLLSYYFFLQAYPTPQVEVVSTMNIHGTQVVLSHGAHDPIFNSADFAQFLKREAPRWARHVESAINGVDVCFLTYETLLQSFEPTLRRLVKYTELPAARGFEETAKVYHTGFGKVFAGNNRDFFRRGIIGDWKNWYEPAHALLLDELIGSELRAFGFENDPEWATRFGDSQISRTDGLPLEPRL